MANPRPTHARTTVTAKLIGLALGAALLALPLMGAAQGPPISESERAARRAARREEREQLHNEVLDQMRAMRMWKLTEELGLDQATAAKVFPLLAEYDEKARELARQRFDIAREVKDQTRAGQPDNRRLQVLIDQLLTNQTRRKALDDERFRALRPSLKPLQQAKLLLLLPRLEDDFRRRIREAMDENAAPAYATATPATTPPRRRTRTPGSVVRLELTPPHPSLSPLPRGEGEQAGGRRGPGANPGERAGGRRGPV